MPCRCDYLEPTEREEESKLVCKLLIYLSKMWGDEKHLPKHILAASKDMYGSLETLDKDTALLCRWCKYIDSNPVEHHLMYDGRSKDARKLADWWEKHKEADKQREAEEEAERKYELESLKLRAKELGYKIVKE